MRPTREDIAPPQEPVESLESLIDSLVAHHAAPASGVPPTTPARQAIERLAGDEVATLGKLLSGDEDRRCLDHLAKWLEQDIVRLGPLLEERRARQVTSWALAHPDSRLRHDGRTLLANAIGRDLEAPGAELPADPASDLAALLVGLESRESSSLMRLALDRYLRFSGDYEQARLLSLFGTAHALSAARRALQRRPAEGCDPEHPALLAESMAECRRFLALAERIAEFRFPPLVIGVGVSGSGKSRFTGGLVTRLGAIRVCSDVERRRLHGLPLASGHPQALAAEEAVDIFSAEATERTYHRLAASAGALLDAGIPVCVDATCLKRWQRDLLRQQAEGRGLPCLMVSFEADEATLKRRIEKRARRHGVEVTSSLAILERQGQAFEPFDDEERLYLVHLDTTAEDAAETLVGLIGEHVKLT